METDIISFLDLLHDKEKNNSSDLIDRKTQSSQISDQIKSNDSNIQMIPIKYLAQIELNPFYFFTEI